MGIFLIKYVFVVFGYINNVMEIYCDINYVKGIFLVI